jgi:hypothetical protein
MEVEDTPEVEELPVAEEQPEQAEQVEQAEQPAAEPEELQVTIAGEEPEPEPERAPEWVRDLRKQHRELQKKVREYEEREKAVVAPTVGPKPKLEDHDYDTEKYEVALEVWYRQKDKAEAVKREQERAIEEQQKAWQAKLDSYGKAKADLKAKDYDDAEAVVQEAMSVTQQGIVLQGADNPALVVYALGKNPKRAKELAAITDPVRFAFAVARLESQLKVTPKAKPPAPEKPMPTGTAPVSGVDSVLERLRDEAAKTGDMTKVLRYKAQQKAKAK